MLVFFLLFAVLKQRSCFREKPWKSTKPIVYNSHQNSKLKDKVFKGEKNKIWSSFLFSFQSEEQSYTIIVHNFLSSARKAGNTILAFLFKIWIYALKCQTVSQGIPESWGLPNYRKADSHIPCASNIVWIYFVCECGTHKYFTAEVLHGFHSSIEASIVLAVHLLQNKRVIFFTLYWWGTMSQDTEDLNSKNKDCSLHLLWSKILL